MKAQSQLSRKDKLKRLNFVKSNPRRARTVTAPHARFSMGCGQARWSAIALRICA